MASLPHLCSVFSCSHSGCVCKRWMAHVYYHLSLQDRMEMEEEETGARSPLITFSHFLPHQVPIMRWLGRPVLLVRHRRSAARLR